MVHAAIEQKDLAGLKAALAAGKDPNELDASGFTALEKAATVGTDEMLAALLDAGADPKRAKASVLGAAVRRRMSKMVTLLLERKVDPNHSNHPELLPMRWALRWSAQMVITLLEHGATLPGDLAPWTVGVEGSAAEKERLIELALERTTDPTVMLRSLMRSTSPRLQEWMKQLVDRGANLRPTNAVSPLHEAASDTNAHAARALIAVGASVDEPLAVEWTELADDDSDQGWRVIAPMGTTVRAFYSDLYQKEVAYLRKNPHPERSKRLEQTLAALGIEAPTTPSAPTSPFGTWVEVKRESVTADEEDGRSSRAVKGGTFEWSKDGTWSVSGVVGCGLSGKGRLELAGSRLTVRRTKAPALTGAYDGATVRIESEPDDEHGLVVTSVFELQTPAAPGKQKPAAAKKAAPARKPPAAKKAAPAKKKR